MRKLIKSSRANSGFTLIELLIVIVIIGILAGVLIAVINPVRQQNRARNAAVRAAVLKAAFAVNTVRAGIGTLPSNTALSQELENITPIAASCTGATTLNCQFTMSGTTLPTNCGADFVRPGGTNVCRMHVVSTGTNLTTGQFRIAAAKFSLNSVAPENTYYVFDSGRGLLECPNTVVYTGTGNLPATCVSVSE